MTRVFSLLILKTLLLALALLLSAGCGTVRSKDETVAEKRARIHSSMNGLRETMDHLRPSARLRREGRWSTAFRTLFGEFFGPYSFDDLSDSLDLWSL